MRCFKTIHLGSCLFKCAIHEFNCTLLLMFFVWCIHTGAIRELKQVIMLRIREVNTVRGSLWSIPQAIALLALVGDRVTVKRGGMEAVPGEIFVGSLKIPVQIFEDFYEKGSSKFLPRSSKTSSRSLKVVVCILKIFAGIL